MSSFIINAKIEMNNISMPNNRLNKAIFSSKANMHGFSLLLVLVVMLFTKLAFNLFIQNWPTTNASDLSAENITNAINRERDLRNLTVLNSNSKLTAAGQSKAEDMQARHYFSHIDPDGNYIWDKIIAQGYTPYIQLGENLAIEFYDTDSLVSAWMNSPTHRANILQEGFRDQGLGLAFGNSQAGEYHSAIANTFGTLAQSVKPKTTTPAPTTSTKTTKTKKNVAPSPILATPENTEIKKNTQPEIPSTNQSVAAVKDALKLRSLELAMQEAEIPNFTLPENNTYRATSTPTSSPAISGKPQNEKKFESFGNLSSNRIIILAIGFILLILLLSDLKNVLEEKLGSLDKKINNLVLLLIAIVVIIFMYWL